MLFETNYLNYKGVTSAITPFPGCAYELCISHSVEVPEKKRGKGLGSKAHKKRLKYMRDMPADPLSNGWTCALCTVNSDNKAQLKILKKNGWKKIHSFKSNCICSGHHPKILIFAKDLQK